MDQNTKARKMLEAANQAADEYRTEGKPEMANIIETKFAELPVGSLATLYDIIKGVK